MSFGGSGSSTQASNDFATAATTGGPVAFASSGDAGYLVAPSFPAADPWVVAVGGTRVNAVQANASDWGWQFSGGGTYIYMQANQWMTQIQPQNVTAGKRGVPDVAAVADFQNSAVSIYYEDRWILSGGTSAASPIWAGIAALFGESVGASNQTLLAKLGTPEGGFSEVLYQMAGSTNADSLFYRTTAGSNNPIGAYCPLCTATGTYNEVTGLGSPNVAGMMAYLGGKAPATAASETSSLGQPAYRMTRAMLRARVDALQARQAPVQGKN
jgi:kumamolisin